MTLAAAATLAGRRAAEALMVDACTVTHRTGRASFSETTGRAAQASTTIYSGPCRVQLPQAQPQADEVGARVATTQRAVLSLPVSAAAVLVGADVEITAAALDPQLVGTRLRVVGVHHKTHATARRLECEEVT